MRRISRKFDYNKYVILPLNLLLFVGALAFMQVISDLRLKELRLSLLELSKEELSQNVDFLLSRYKIIANRSMAVEVKPADYLNESKIFALISSEFSDRAISNQGLGFLEAPAVYFVNALNSLTGKKNLLGTGANLNRKLLQAAYFYERKRDFNKAVALYSAALDHQNLDANETRFIYLHRGFSYSLLNQKSRAFEDFAMVKKLDKNGQYAAAAASITGFLKQAEQKERGIDDMSDSLDKGEAYYRVVAYKKAIEIFNKLEKSERKIDRQKLLFYRGRAYEELGQAKYATADYQRLIKINTSSKWALYANRRLYLLGALYEKNEQLKAEANDRAEQLADKGFVKNIEPVERVIKKEEAHEVIVNKDENREVALLLKDNEASIKIQVTGEIDIEPEEKGLVEVEVQKPSEQKKPAESNDRVVESKPPNLTEKLADPALTQEKRKELLLKHKLLDRIYTVNGSMLVGVIVSKQRKKIEVITTLGKMSIPREKIKYISRVPANSALK